MIDARKSLISYHLVELFKILESSTTISSLMGGRNEVIISSSSKVCVNWMLLGFVFQNQLEKLFCEHLSVCYVQEIVL